MSYIYAVQLREKRRSDLRERYNFDCQCEGCDLTDAQALQEFKIIEAYKEEELKQESLKYSITMSLEMELPDRALGLIKEKALSLKRMYRLAKNIKTFGRRSLLVDIVDEAFNVSCEGAKLEEEYRNREGVKRAWIKDAKMFATIGCEIAKTLNGADNSWTQQWNERAADPMKFILKMHFQSLL